MSEVIHLNLVNDSNSINGPEIVIFQKNVATGFQELAAAWTVAKNLGQGQHHPFTYSDQMEISVSDSWGNETPRLPASAGDNFQVFKDPAGIRMELEGKAVSPEDVSLINNLEQGSVNVNIYRDGKLLGVEPNIVPEQKAVFQFKPVLFIGVAYDLTEGEMITSEVISQAKTEISLEGVNSADIIMTGGGEGPDAKPYSFALEHVEMA